MATQMQMIQALIDKIEKQAKHSALIDWEIAHLKKESADWQHRALKAEAKLADQVEWEISSQNNYEAYKEEQRKVFRLESELEDARLILEPLTQCNDLVEGLAYKDMAVDFVQKWGMKLTDPYAGLVEYKEAVSR